MKTIVLTATALKQLLALPLAAQLAIEEDLDGYAVTGHGDVKRLTGGKLLRLRVGRYRVIFAEDARTILAVEITKRETTTYKGGRVSMSEPTFIDTPKGDQLVILTRAEYDALMERLRMIEEDAADVAIGTARLAEWEAAGRPAYPLPVARLIREGESPMRAFRHDRNLSLQDLAVRSGIDPASIEQIEAGQTTPNPKMLAALAKALDTTEASLRPFVNAGNET